ncbi:hypothetical protein HKX48_000797 [Thoreauomyces humboldtii]|nr:hypothetical protein HKX48_000797 [Thoreauomyces humboldtii]
MSNFQILPENDIKAFKNHCQSACKKWLQDRSGPLPQDVVTHERFVPEKFRYNCGICVPRHSGQGRFDGCFYHKYDQARHEWNKHKTYKYFVQHDDGTLTVSPWDPREQENQKDGKPARASAPVSASASKTSKRSSTRKPRKRKGDDEGRVKSDDEDENQGAEAPPPAAKPRTKRVKTPVATRASSPVVQGLDMENIKSEAQRIIDSNLEGMADFLVLDQDAPGESEHGEDDDVVDDDDDEEPELHLEGDALWPSWVPRWVPRGENAESSSSSDDEEEEEVEDVDYNSGVPVTDVSVDGPVSALPAPPPGKAARVKRKTPAGSRASSH